MIQKLSDIHAQLNSVGNLLHQSPAMTWYLSITLERATLIWVTTTFSLKTSSAENA